MNPAMWENQATQDNLQTLSNRGINIIQPESGDMACGETGVGRMVEADDILSAINDFLSKGKPLTGKHAIVTSGPTFEPIDPVRYIGNRSSGKQGHAIACALRDYGANVTLISGPTALSKPDGINILNVETATEMMATVQNSLPADIAICAAAVADYGVKPHSQKHKKSNGTLNIELTDNPDILLTLSTHKKRPDIVIGFAAETENVTQNAKEKLVKKGCDAIIANQVGIGKVFGTDNNNVTWISKIEEKSYNTLSKFDVADMIAHRIIDFYKNNKKAKIA